MFEWLFSQEKPEFFFGGLAIARPENKYFLVGEGAEKTCQFFLFWHFKHLNIFQQKAHNFF